MFDLNDFDDAIIGPLYYDVLRLSTSLILGGRELGADATSFGEALMAALRQDPDVILVGEMRDIETIGIQQVNEAYERVIKSDVRYRFVIDIATLAG